MPDAKSFARSRKPKPKSKAAQVREARAQAAERARKKRQASVLPKTRAAKERHLVRDIRRVAADEALPYAGTCSRAKYRKYGWFEEEEVFDLFGNHEEFQRVAGLRDSRETTAQRNRRAKIKTEERILEYATASVLPWVGRYERAAASSGAERLVVGSDFHGKHVSRFALSVFLDVIERVQPEYVCLNGDVVDFAAVSRWSQNPNRLLDLQGEIDWTRENILTPVRAAAPEAQVDWVIGNHEYRLIRYLGDAARGLASLRCLDFADLFGLEEFRINMVWNRSSIAPAESDRKRQFKRNWKEYGDRTYVCFHGNATGKFPAAKEIADFGMSGTSGHVHRPQLHSMPTLANEYADWMSTGMMADHSAGDEYVVGPTKWTIGFGFVTLFPGERVALQVPVLCKKGIAEFGGVVYRERGA